MGWGMYDPGPGASPALTGGPLLSALPSGLPPLNGLAPSQTSGATALPHSGSGTPLPMSRVGSLAVRSLLIPASASASASAITIA
jgi:hypothetical protein